MVFWALEDSRVGISSSVFSTLVTTSSRWSCRVGGLRFCSCLSKGVSWLGTGSGERMAAGLGVRLVLRISADIPLVVELALVFGGDRDWLFSAALSYAATDARMPWRSGVQTISPVPSRLPFWIWPGLWCRLDLIGEKLFSRNPFCIGLLMMVAL